MKEIRKLDRLPEYREGGWHEQHEYVESTTQGIQNKLINDLVEAVQELQIQSEFHSEHLAGIMTKVHGQETRYTVAELREKAYGNYWSYLHKEVTAFLDWLESEGK